MNDYLKKWTNWLIQEIAQYTKQTAANHKEYCALSVRSKRWILSNHLMLFVLQTKGATNDIYSQWTKKANISMWNN